MPLTSFRIEDFKGYRFQNCYLGDNHYKQNTNYVIYIVVQPILKKRFFEFANNVVTSPHFYDVYSSNGYTIFAFEVPDESKHIIDLFKQGKYSKFDKEYIERHFPKKIEVIDRDGQVRRKVSQVRKVFDKHKDLRDHWYQRAGIELSEEDEHWSIPLMEEETFREKLY